MKLRRTVAFSFAVSCVLCARGRCQEPVTPEALSPEQQAWREVNVTDITSLEEFLLKFPDGTHKQEASRYLSLDRRIAAVRAGIEKSSLVIPFEQLEKPWNGPNGQNEEKAVLIVYCKRNERGASLGVRFGSASADRRISFDDAGVLRAPMGDGAIIGFDTDGLKAQLSGSIVGLSVLFDGAVPDSVALQCPKGEVLYFGVIHGRGMVHIGGTGRMFLLDGKAVDLKSHEP